MFLFLRPGLFDFLDTLYKRFELVLFNNDKKEYTEKIVETMMQQSKSEVKNYFSFILSNEHCSLDDSGH